MMIEIAGLTVMVSVVVILITLMVSVAFSHYRAAFPLTSNSNASKESSSPSSPSAPASSSRSWKYDVFLSFRGEDTRKTFVDHLYLALEDRSIHTYKDDVTLLRGDTIGPSLLNAIEESQIAIIIFSKNYANSSWCLDELAYIMKCTKKRGQTVIPVFYHVEPTDVRKQKGEFGKAFAKLTKQKDIAKTELWKKALVDASNIAGWEPKHVAGGHEAKCIRDIVGTILDKLLYLNSVVDENLVGMGTRLQDLKLRLEIGSGGVRMVGIWGIGGGGKTTLASSLYIEMSEKFDSCCFLGNIKGESSKPNGLETMQGRILSTVLKKKVKVESVDIGKHTIKSRLGRRNVLLLLDDIDDCKQLEALAGSHHWFGDGSRIIITTRNEQLLRTHRVNEVIHVSLLSHEEAIRLFNRCAYNECKQVKDYMTLSHRVVSYASGLPLALKVLGSFLYDKDKDEWISTLDRLKDIPEMEILEKLKISYDGLKPVEKELFLDIACFCRGMSKIQATEMLDACGLHPGIGVKVLIQKALITITLSCHFDMHDLVQDMGHYIVRKEHPNHPEKHSRLWRFEEIEDMCSWNEITENNKIEAIICHRYPSDCHKLVSKAKKLRLLYVNNLDEGDIQVPEYLSNELRYMFFVRYPAIPFPESFHLRKLVFLRLIGSLQKEVWKGNKYLPCLKVLHLFRSPALVMTPDIGGLPCLQKLTLESCDKLEEIHPSLGYHTSLVSVNVNDCEKLRKFPTIVQMGKLEVLEIYKCDALHTFPKIEANMDNFINLSLKDVGIEAFPSTVGKYCTKLRMLMLERCTELKSIEGNFHALKHLQKCKIQSSYTEPINLPKDLFHEHIHLEDLYLTSIRLPSIPKSARFIRRLTLSSCGLKDGEIPCNVGELSNLQELDLSWNEFSRLNFSLLQLIRLKLLNLECCKNLVELPELPTSIAILVTDYCGSLEVVGDINKDCKWLCQVSLRKVRSVTGGDRLLQSLLKGHAFENGCMLLQLDGIEIPKGFIRPLLLKGSRYLLNLSENWYNQFSGFLICATLRENNFMHYISMKHEKGELKSLNSHQKVYWEESDDVEETLMMYISFGSLKHTLWWDPTSTAIEFSLSEQEYDIDDFDDEFCSGFGVGLVSKTNESDQIETTTTTTNSSPEPSDPYTCCNFNFSIEHDSESNLMCQFDSYYKYRRRSRFSYLTTDSKFE